jgi:hypothetical protein
LQSLRPARRVAELGSLGHFRAFEFFGAAFLLTRGFGDSIFEMSGSDSSSGARLRFCGRVGERRQLDFSGGEQILSQRFLCNDDDVA